MADKPNPNALMQYAGYAAQLAVALVLAVYAGMWLDKQTGFHFPILIWLLPLVILIGMMIKVVRDTTKK